MGQSTMDIGRLGSEQAVFKRKFRWLFTVSDYGYAGQGWQSQGNIVSPGTKKNDGHICKISSRPSISFNEQEIQHVIETIYLPAKPTWDSIDVVVYDLKGEDYLYRWIKAFYNPETGQANPAAQDTYYNTDISIGYPKKIATLELLDGHGNKIEYWILQGCWPVNITWGEVDYSSSETLDINFSLRYDRAVQYTIPT